MDRDLGALEHYRESAPYAVRAHPTEDHFLPLLVALGASAPDDAVGIIEGGIEHGILSMDSFGWGLPVEPASGWARPFERAGGAAGQREQH
jgi:4,5-DOPA dioxygenase extradiol